MAVLSAAAMPCLAEPPQAATKGLTVALLDLAAAPDLFPPPKVEIRPAWRTSFGAERTTAPAPKPDSREALLEALAAVDVVLIQGVRSARPLRRLFPARQWRLVVSRHAAVALDSDRRPAEGDTPPLTAVAVRAQADLKVTARAFALRLAPPPSPDAVAHSETTLADDVPADTAADAAAGEAFAIDVVSALPPPLLADLPHPATAVRLQARGRSLWFAAIALPPACAAEDPPCPALRDLDLWRGEKRARGEPALIGGRMNSASTSEQPPDECATYAIEADLEWKPLGAAAGGISPVAGKGCIVTLRLDD